MKKLSDATPSLNEEMEADTTIGSVEDIDPNIENEDYHQTDDNENIENNEQIENNDYDDVWDSEEIDIENLDKDKDNINDNEDEYIEDKDNPNNDNNVLDENDDKEKDEHNIIITKPLKYRGKEIWVKSEDEIIELAQKGLDYSFKMSKIKPLRNIASIIEEAGIEPEDVKALADAKNGNKEAIKYIANKFNIDITDYSDDLFSDEEDNNQNYKPEIEQADSVAEYYSELSNREPELAGKVNSIWNELDDQFKNELYNDNIFQAFVNSIKIGEFEKVYPLAIKVKALNPALTWLQAYQYAIQDIGSVNKQKKEPSMNNNKVQKVRKKPKTIKENYDELWNQPLDELEKELFS